MQDLMLETDMTELHLRDKKERYVDVLQAIVFEKAAVGTRRISDGIYLNLLDDPFVNRHL